MTLASYSPPRKDIAVGVGSLSLRGLNLDDISLLMSAHSDKLFSAFQQFESIVKSDNPESAVIARLVFDLINEAPQVAADIIALAADEPDHHQNARKLPFPVQVQALITVANLTFEAGGGLGELKAALVSVGRGLGLDREKVSQDLLPSHPTSSKSGMRSRQETVSSGTKKPSEKAPASS
jgi:hypothetical protein